MTRILKSIAGFALLACLVVPGTATAAKSLGVSEAETRFDQLGVNYQRHLTDDSFSRVSCVRSDSGSFDCGGLWKITALSDEGVRTRFTFKARGTVVSEKRKTIARARFVKWETVGGITKKTSSVSISSTQLFTS